MAIDEPQPPYGLSYTSPGPPLFATPFMTAANGSFTGNPFPLNVPVAEHLHQESEFEREFLAYSNRMQGMTAPRAMEHVSLQRELLSFRRAAVWREYDVQRELRRIAGASPAAGLFRQSRQSGLVSVAQPAERSRSRDRRPAGRSAKTPLTPARPDRSTNGTRSGLGPDFANDDYDAQHRRTPTTTPSRSRSGIPRRA